MTSKESLHSDILQFQQHQQNEQTSSPLKLLNMKETMTNGVGYPGVGTGTETSITITSTLDSMSS